MKRGLPSLAVAFLVTAAGAYAGYRLTAGPGAAAAAGASSPTARLDVTGQVEGLYPGARRRLSIRIRNRTGVRIVVRSIQVYVQGARARCSAGNLVTQPYHGRLRRFVGPRRTAELGFPIAMRAQAPDACQGARFPLRFRVQAGR
jgi:hypothetical protein